MNYRLNRHGEDLGVYPLEELRRRRQTGELTGIEYVWAEGAAEWQLLDSVLREAQGAPAAVAPFSSLSKSGRPGVWISVGIAGAMVSVVVLGAIFFIPRLARILGIRRQQIAQGPMAYDALGAANKPTATNANTLTEADARQRARKFRERQWIDGYQQRGNHDQPCDAQARQLLDAWLSFNYGGNNTNQPGPLADKLAAQAGCDDPLVLTLAGVLSSENHEAIRRYERALKNFPASRHRAYPKFYANLLLARALGNDSPQAGDLDVQAFNEFKASFTDGSFLPEDQAEIAEILFNQWGRNFFSRNPQRIGAAIPPGKPFEWLRQVLEGESHIIQAWKLRGRGFTDSVSQKGWEGFARESAQARQCFTKAFELRPDLPLAPCRMIYVSLGDGNIGEMRKWFDRTIAVQIDYPQAWSDMRWGLRPRWYGDLDAMLALGATALDTGRFDTDVPRMVFDSISDIESEMNLPTGEHIYGRSDIWPLLQRMYEGYIAETSQANGRDGWRSTYVVVAYLGGKYDVARAQLEAMQWKPRTRNFDAWQFDLSLLPLEVAARTGPSKKEITRAETERAAGHVKQALELYRELNTTTNSDPRTGEFIRARLASLEIEQRLQNHEWVDLIPASDKDLAWNFLAGTARRLPDGALEVESGIEGHALYSRARVMEGFEVIGEFELVQSSSADFQAGLLMGLPDSNRNNMFTFRMKRNAVEGQIASFSVGWGKNGSSRPITLNDKRNSFSVRFQGDKLTASVNGQEVFKDLAPPFSIHIAGNEFFLGLGAFNDMNETLIRYRNVRLHLLAGAPGK